MYEETPFRVILLLMMIGYITARAYYLRKARRSNPQGESHLQNVTESKVRLTLLGISGLSADLLSVVWVIHPSSVVESVKYAVAQLAALDRGRRGRGGCIAGLHPFAKGRRVVHCQFGKTASALPQS